MEEHVFDVETVQKAVGKSRWGCAHSTLLSLLHRPSAAAPATLRARPGASGCAAPLCKGDGTPPARPGHGKRSVSVIRSVAVTDNNNNITPFTSCKESQPGQTPSGRQKSPSVTGW